jgi:poly-gamma-glutamate synthesis protein (capsule biosynthesis protein)
MKKIFWYAKLIVLLPVAIFNDIKDRRYTGIVVLLISMLCIILAGAGKMQFGSSVQAASQEEPAEKSTEPVATPAEASAPVTKTVTLTFAGDCTLGMDSSFDYSSSWNAVYAQNGAAYFLQNVRDIFSADDLTIVNFEGTLTESQDRADKTWAFKGDREYVQVLTEGSVEAANLANNHSSDYGPQSYTDTVDTLEQAGLVTFGGDTTALVEANGVQVGLIGMYTVYSDDGYVEQLQSRIRGLQDQGAEVIVACFHWGLENSYEPDLDQTELAHAAIDAGAALVIGHHPHVLQGVEVYKGRYIVYSLGNFCFGGNSGPSDYDCMIFQQTFTVTDGSPQVDDNIQVIPCSISSVTGWNNYQPTPADGTEKQRILDKLERISNGLGTRNIFAE